MKKALFIVLLIPLIGAGISLGTWAGKQHQVLPAQDASQKVLGKSEHIEAAAQPAVPKKLSIPSIQIDAEVESVGMDAKGRMDVPKDADNVAWYNLGSKPGEKGSSVIAGHFDKETGGPAVFYKLKELAVGDKVITTDVNGQSQTFVVTRIAHHADDTFPLQEVFGQSQKPVLNLITCDGKWNNDTKSYSHRTVVYTELLQ